MKITKQKFFFPILFLISIVFVSCKKDYECACGGGESDNVTIIINDTRKKAMKKCDDINTESPQYTECFIAN